MRSVTDSELAHLKLDEFLDQSLDRVREVMNADTAAVLLIDAAGRSLVATAAKGLEEEVRQGVRIPLHKGFAGRIASTRQPMVLDQVDHTTVFNPILVEKGIRTLMGAPLLVGGDILGVIHVGTLTERRFTADDVSLLQMVADRIALATKAKLDDDTRTAATTLQRSLLPPMLPSVEGLDLAARYAPGQGGVGGDWYDVFELPSGRLGIAMGDVMGRGLRAAATMGRVRTALRAFALQDDSPAAVISLLDRMVHHFEGDEIVTLAYGVMDPSHGTITLCTAGHPPTLIVTPQEGGRFLDVGAGPPLNVEPDTSRHEATIDVPTGSTVYFFTDGLIERRDLPIDEGLDRLRATALPEPAQDACARILLTLVGSLVLEDDVALLAVHRTNP